MFLYSPLVSASVVRVPCYEYSDTLLQSSLRTDLVLAHRSYQRHVDRLSALGARSGISHPHAEIDKAATKAQDVALK